MRAAVLGVVPQVGQLLADLVPLFALPDVRPAKERGENGYLGLNTNSKLLPGIVKLSATNQRSVYSLMAGILFCFRIWPH